VGYNPYIYTGAKAALNSYGAAQREAIRDEFVLNSNARNDALASELKSQIGETRKKQGENYSKICTIAG